MFSNRATCLKLIGKYKQAINDFKKALELAPRNTKNIKKLANVYVVMGNFGEAEILLQKCINLEPEDSTNTTEHNKIKQKIIWGTIISICFVAFLVVLFAFFQHESVNTINSLY